MTSKEKLGEIVNKLRKEKLDAYSVDITLPKFRKLGYYVAKVLIPGTNPFYLNERVPYFGGYRLYKVPKKIGLSKVVRKEKELNTIPHPFL